MRRTMISELGSALIAPISPCGSAQRAAEGMGRDKSYEYS